MREEPEWTRRLVIETAVSAVALVAILAFMAYLFCDSSNVWPSFIQPVP